MLILPLDQARPGMKLVMSVNHPERPEQELLKPGYILDALVLQKMRHMGVPTVYIDYPDLADLDRHLIPYLSPARQVIYSQVKATIEAVQKTARPTVTFTDYYAATQELVLTLMRQGEHPIHMEVLANRLGADAVAHATAVAQLSLTLGIRLSPYIVQQRKRLDPDHAREVVNLGVAGMLHDVGKARLPPQLQQCDICSEPEMDDQRREWQAHPQIGFEMVQNGVQASAAAAVRLHHHHFDGTGFPPVARVGKPPELLAGERIHVFARILLVADLFDRLSNARSRRVRRPTIEVLHVMRTQYASWIDPYILRALPGIIPPFPPGSRLLLSDQTMAVVTAMDPADPYRPTVRRLGDDGLSLAGPPMPLRSQSSLRIHSIEGVPVERIIDAALSADAPPAATLPAQRGRPGVLVPQT